MTTFLLFASLSLGAGAAYSLLASGIVLVFRGSGVLNLAHGAFAMVAAYLFYQLWQVNQVPWAIALPLVVVITGALSGLMYLLLLRRLQTATSLVRVAATLGVLILLESAVSLKWGGSTIVVNAFLPQQSWHFSGVPVAEDQIIALTLTVVITVALWWMWRFTNLGRATSAIAENRRAAAALGWSPDLVATVNWVLGGVLAALAGIFIADFIGTIDPVTLTLLVIAGMAVALIGGLASFPLVLVGGIGVGIAEAEVQHYFPQSGTPQFVPLVVIVAFLLIRGRSLPLRSHVLERLPRLGSGRVSLRAVLAVSGVTIVLILTVLPVNLVAALTTLMLGALMLLSVVVLTGYAGQLSLAQYAIGGMAALVTARLVADSGWGFIPALVAGVIVATAVGLIFGLPALRARGTTLAVITLTLGAAVQAVIFTQPSLTGGANGTVVPPVSLFGLQVGAVSYPRRYGVVAVVVFVIAALSISCLRRSRAGRRLIAVRANERAAAAMGISVFESKLFAFALSSIIAALAGTLSAFVNTTILFQNFDPLSSIYAVAYAVIGGVGYIIGPLFGGQLIAGSLGTWATNELFPNLTSYIAVIGGILLLVILVSAPDGLAWQSIQHSAKLRGRLSGRKVSPVVSDQPLSIVLEPVLPRVLEVRELSVSFGGVNAVSNVSFTVAPGEIVGMIGPNGAGKTTVIDAVTGFVKTAHGEVLLGGRRLSGLSAYRRARAGISRSFQSMDLLDDVSVKENLKVASDRHDRIGWILGLVHPGRESLSASAQVAVIDLDLTAFLDNLPPSLPQAQRRLVGVARAVASQPSIVLLDEPAAGLDELAVRKVAQVIEGLAKDRGMGVLLIEHDVSFVLGISDRVIALDRGEQLAEGLPAEIRSNPFVVASYLGESYEKEATRDVAAAGTQETEVGALKAPAIDIERTP